MGIKEVNNSFSRDIASFQRSLHFRGHRKIEKDSRTIFEQNVANDIARLHNRSQMIRQLA